MKALILKNLIDFLCVFLIVYLVYSLFINRNKKEYKDLKDKDPIKSYIARYNLDMRKTKYKTILRTLTFINSLIIAVVTIVYMNINGLVWSIIISFITIFILLYGLYEITGKYFKKKEK
jgi:uncharacterized membrane protein